VFHEINRPIATSPTKYSQEEISPEDNFLSCVTVYLSNTRRATFLQNKSQPQQRHQLSVLCNYLLMTIWR